MIRFELKDRDGLGRICLFSVDEKKIETPALLPVINPNMMIVPPGDMKKFGAQALITNAYIIKKNEELSQAALSSDIHRLLDFDGLIMTDSGTFQSHVYGDLDVKNDEIVEFQRKIGTDIGTPLDIFIEPGTRYDEAKKAVDETIERIKEAKEIAGDMAVSAPVQGGLFPDLREFCAREVSRIDCAVHPIGGVVPLMETQRFSELVDVIIASKKGLTHGRPVHLFGCGHPMVFPLAVLLGCDMFDSAAYAKYARDGRLIFEDGTRHIDEMKDSPCFCPVCSGYTIDEIRKALPEERVKLIAEHNLYVSFGMIKKVKNAIREGTLWELTERTCRSHPALLSALKQIRRHADFLERFEPLSRTRAFFYTGPESMDRPAVYRYRKRIQRHKPKSISIWLPETKKPYGAAYQNIIREIHSICDAAIMVRSYFGPAPIELDETYPIGQSVFPDEVDEEIKKKGDEVCREFARIYGTNFIEWDGKKTLDELRSIAEEKYCNPDIERIRAIADFQFGAGASDALLKGDIRMKKSPATGKIRNVYSDGEHILSLRAEDGFFTLKIAGAKRLMFFKPPALRVIVNKDSAEFNRQGCNVFAQFVIDCDEEIRPGDEVLVADEKDELVAVGKSLMNREEMLSFKSGVAVKVREGFEKHE